MMRTYDFYVMRNNTGWINTVAVCRNCLQPISVPDNQQIQATALDSHQCYQQIISGPRPYSTT